MDRVEFNRNLSTSEKQQGPRRDLNLITTAGYPLVLSPAPVYQKNRFNDAIYTRRPQPVSVQSIFLTNSFACRVKRITQAHNKAGGICGNLWG